MVVNENACILNDRGAGKFFASELLQGSSAHPGIYHFNTAELEISNIAGGYGSPMASASGGNLRICH